MKNDLISIKEALSFGWETFKKDPWFYIGATAALTIFSMLVNALTSGGSGVGGLLGFIISLLASTVVTIAYTRMALSSVAGAHVGWDGLWAPEHFFNTLGASIIQMVIVFIGFVLLVIPGIIAALMLSMTQLSVVDKKMNPIEAIKESYRLTKTHLWPLFLFMLVLMLLNLVGLIALVVGLLVTVPVSLIAAAYVYKKLVGAHEPAVVPADATTTPQ